MAAAFIHYFLGVGIAYLCGFEGLEALLVGLLGAIQDIDFVLIFFQIRRRSRSRVSQLFTHRGITHTLVFALGVSAAVLVVNPVFSLVILIGFVLHIFTDYVTAWGVSPFLPFSDKRYSLGLMTIFDIPLTLLSLAVGASGFVSVNPLVPFAAFFGYIGVRYVLRIRLPYQNLEPMGNFTYVFCTSGSHYTVGKVDILGRTHTIEVPQMSPGMDAEVIEKISAKTQGGMISHFMEYPVYSRENGHVTIRDARSYLFPRSSRLFTLYYDEGQDRLYMMTAGRKIPVS
ncbi:MAG: metal-dependent hydrolase [Theionarchaea archaeon]|nr:metal-dependent hydrolase [Theionarchaea archaeon]MBU7021918.1 metal-dependent hydrolase [Theionarchaea archaeon]MBU7035529.1 metal-dependent hydrolase [Theionarchaea archaeon]MBU7040368.1 metal-dependent hydrolase [Theionarchaea archaeon]